MSADLEALGRAVRRSTLKWLELVPVGCENWRIDADAMSFADTAQHLIDSDRWLVETLRTRSSEPIVGRAGLAQVRSRDDYRSLLEKLRMSGDDLAQLLGSFEEAELSESVRLPEFGGEMTRFWTVVRAGFDHEAHHRGQVVAYLRALRASGQIAQHPTTGGVVGGGF